jgi:hypothetical protein
MRRSTEQAKLKKAGGKIKNAVGAIERSGTKSYYEAAFSAAAFLEFRFSRRAEDGGSLIFLLRVRNYS